MSRADGAMPEIGIETVTNGVARATCHRVLSPDPADGPRYSIPYFQMISQTVYLDRLRVFEEDKPLHPEVEKLVQARGPSKAADGKRRVPTRHGSKMSVL